MKKYQPVSFKNLPNVDKAFFLRIFNVSLIFKIPPVQVDFLYEIESSYRLQSKNDKLEV